MHQILFLCCISYYFSSETNIFTSKYNCPWYLSLKKLRVKLNTYKNQIYSGGFYDIFRDFGGIKIIGGIWWAGGFRFCRWRWAPTDPTHPGGVALIKSLCSIFETRLFQQKSGCFRAYTVIPGVYPGSPRCPVGYPCKKFTIRWWSSTLYAHKIHWKVNFHEFRQNISWNSFLNRYFTQKVGCFRGYNVIVRIAWWHIFYQGMISDNLLY